MKITQESGDLPKVLSTTAKNARKYTIVARIDVIFGDFDAGQVQKALNYHLG